MHGDDDGKLISDVKQDCDKLNIDSKSRSISFERSFDTCDDDDYIIEVINHKIILISNKLCLPNIVKIGVAV